MNKQAPPTYRPRGRRAPGHKDPTLDSIDQAHEALDLLEESIRLARTQEWHRAPSRDESAYEVRGRGGYKDPTGDTACDPARLGVRMAIKQADRDLAHIVSATNGAASRVRQASRRWESAADR